MKEVVVHRRAKEQQQQLKDANLALTEANNMLRKISRELQRT